MNKYYRVEIVYTAFLGMASSNTYSHYAEAHPENTTEHFPTKDVHKAYFTDPAEAEEYRQQVIREIVPNQEVSA